MKTYIAEFDKLKPADFATLKKASEEDKILLFCKKDISLSIEQFKQLNALTSPPEFITADSEAERCFYAGVAYASGKTVFVTSFSLPKAIQTIVSDAPVQRRRTLRTKTAGTVATATPNETKESGSKEKSTTDPQNVFVRKKKTSAAETVKKTPTEKKTVAKEREIEDRTDDVEDEVEIHPAQKRKESPIWADSSSEAFYKKFCSLPNSTEGYDDIILKTAKIFAASSDGKVAVKEIEKQFGSEIAEHFKKNTNILLTCIYNGLSKQVQK